MTTLKELTDALKYLGRLDKFAFKMLLFPDATEDYLDDKWSSFQASLVSFLWICSNDKLDLITGWLSSNFKIDLFTMEEEEWVNNVLSANWMTTTIRTNSFVVIVWGSWMRWRLNNWLPIGIEWVLVCVWAIGRNGAEMFHFSLFFFLRSNAPKALPR